MLNIYCTIKNGVGNSLDPSKREDEEREGPLLPFLPLEEPLELTMRESLARLDGFWLVHLTVVPAHQTAWVLSL